MNYENKIRKIMSPKIIGKNILEKPTMVITEDISPKSIDFKVKEEWIDLDKFEWEYANRIYI
jgi:hypothetical protein